MQRSFLSGLLTSLAFIYSCSPKYQNANVDDRRSKTQPDYSNLNSWAAHPYKYDPSDSIPLPLKPSYQYDSSVDVFFLHPTTYTQKKAPLWNADPGDQGLNDKTDFSTILYQASAFNEYRVFAPRYRQAHLRSYYSDFDEAANAFDTAYEDIKKAFIHYLVNYNNNRPFIIASHSQGTTHAMRLMKEEIENKPVLNQLVAAYLVGMYLPQNYFSSLSTCKDSTDVRCICAWRSFQTNYLPAFVQKEKEPGLVVNPLNWTVEETYVSKNMNKGSVLRNFNKNYAGVADAQIHQGVLWIQKPQFPGSFFLRRKNYHIADINFFYVNIRENVRQRVSSFREKSKSVQ